MNIGIVTTWFERGAAYVSKQMRDTLQGDHQVFIYARGGENKAVGDVNWDGAFVWWGKDIDSPFCATVFSKNDFIRWVKCKSIDLVIFNEQHWWLPLVWCRELGVKTVAYVDYYTEKTVPLFKYYDALICNTHRHYEVFSWHKNARFIPWGTNINLFRPSDPVCLVGEDRPVFFHSCGVSPDRKGTAAVLRAFALSGVDCRLIIHSQVDLVKALPDVGEIIADLKANSKLQIIAGTVTAPGVFHLADVYLYPTVLEGIGLTIAESIASALVPVVTGCPPMSEFVNDDFGCLIPVERFFCRADGYYWPKAKVNESALVGIIKALSSNPEKVLKMKERARAYAVKKLDWNVNSGVLIEMIEDVYLEKNINTVDFNMLLNYERSGGRKFNRYYQALAWFVSPLRRFFSGRL